MARLRLGIGGKLAVSGAVGLVLAASIIAVQLFSSAKVDEASRTSSQLATILEAAQDINIIVRQIQVKAKDIQLAYDPSTIDRLLSDINTDFDLVGARLAEVENVSQSGETRQRFAYIASSLETYVMAAKTLATAQKLQIEALTQRTSIDEAWQAAYFGARQLASLSDNRYVVESLETAALAFQMAQSSSWRFIATGDTAQLAVIDDAFAKTNATLSGMSQVARSDRLMVEALGELKTAAGDYETATRAALTQQQMKKDIVENEADPAVRATLDISRQAIADASKRTRDATAAASAAVADGTTRTYGMVGILIVILVGSAIYAVFKVGRPIAVLTAAMQKISGGNLDTEIPYGRRGDEIGDQARVLAVFRDGLAEAHRLREERAVAEREAEDRRREEIQELADSFEKAVGGVVERVSQAATELQAAAETLTASAEETTVQASAVAAAAEQASANVQTVAAAIEELSASASEIGQQVVQSTVVAGRAVGEADQTNARMVQLKSAAEQIGAVVGLIDDIAAQTNLLALNATIESARAGEAGRGFAVVAQEVKSLAGQTAKATADISNQIGGMQTSTGDAVTAITGIGRTIGDINTVAAAIVAAVEQQGATTAEVARNVQQAAVGTNEVSANIAGVTQAAETSSAAAVQVLSSAAELAKQSETLRGEVIRFLETVRAA